MNKLTLNSIPDEILADIFPYLGDQDLVNLSTTSKEWNQRDDIWEVCYPYFFNMSVENYPDLDRFGNARWLSLYHSSIEFTNSKGSLSRALPHMLQLYERAIAENPAEANPREEIHLHDRPIPNENHHFCPHSIDLKRELPYPCFSKHGQFALKLYQYVSRRFPTSKPTDCSWRDHFFYNHPDNVSRVRRIGETVGMMVYQTSAQISLHLFHQFLDGSLALFLEQFSELVKHNPTREDAFRIQILNIAIIGWCTLSFLVSLAHYKDKYSLDFFVMMEVIRTTKVSIMGEVNFKDGLLALIGVQIGILAKVILELTKKQSNTQTAKIKSAIINALPALLFGSGWSSVGISAYIGYSYSNLFYGRNIIDYKTISEISTLTTLIGSIDSLNMIPTAVVIAPYKLALDPIIANNNALLDASIKIGGSIAEKRSIRKCASLAVRMSRGCSRHRCASITAKASRVCLSLLKAPVKLIGSYLNWRASTNG